MVWGGANATGAGSEPVRSGRCVLGSRCDGGKVDCGLQVGCGAANAAGVGLRIMGDWTSVPVSDCEGNAVGCVSLVDWVDCRLGEISSVVRSDWLEGSVGAKLGWLCSSCSI